MAIDFSVFTKFNAVDRVTKTFRDMGQAASKFGKVSEKSFMQANRAASRFQDVTKGILAAGAVSRGLSAIQAGASAAATEFVNYDQAITSASAKFGGLNLATKEGQATLERLKKTARDVGAATQFSATQAAQGLDFLAMAGFNAEQAMAALPGVVDLATVAGVDLAQATDIASDALGSFNLMSKDSAQLQKNLVRINDVFAKTTSTANTNLVDLFEAVKKGAPEFVQSSQSLETFSAMAGVMANAGIKGEEAGTQLRNMMMNLNAPTAAAAKVLAKLGVKVSDSSGNTRDAIDIMEDLQKGLNKIPGSTQRAAYATEIFGARSAGLKVILGSNIDELREYRKQLEGASGAATQMADIMRQSLLNRLKGLQSALIELSFKVFSQFEKRGQGAIDAITEAVRKFDPAPIIKGLEFAIAVAKDFYNLAKSLAPVVLDLIRIFVMWKAAAIAIQVAIFSVAAAGKTLFVLQKLAQVIRIFWGLQKSIGAAAAAMRIFNIVTKSNPIMAIISGVIMLITGLYLLVTHWDDVTAAIGQAWEMLKKFAAFATQVVSDLFGVETPQWAKDLLEVSTVNPAERFKNEMVTLKSEGASAPEPQAPNAKIEESRANSQFFGGLLNIAGAPQGSTFTPDKRSAPGIDTKFLGWQ